MKNRNRTGQQTTVAKAGEFITKSECARRLGVANSMVHKYLRDPRYSMPGLRPDGRLDWA